MTVPWNQATGRLLDYRDTVIQPVRFLAHHGNPYDPSTYLIRYPWSQEFDPYAPLWLLLVLPLGLLPLRIGGAIFVALLLAGEAWLARTLTGWVLNPRVGGVAAPLLFLWMLVWAPTRYVGASTIVLLAVAGLCTELMRGTSSRWSPLLFSLVWIKPQFGGPLMILLLASHRWRLCLKGVVTAFFLSIVPLICCVVASDGPVGFVRAIVRDIRYASSDSSPTAVASDSNFRVDLPGLTARLGFGGLAAEGAFLLSLALFGAAVGLLLRRRSQCPWYGVAAAAGTTVLLPVHADYDLAFALLALAASVAWFLDSGSSRARWSCLCFALPVIDLHRVSQHLLHLSLPWVEALDTLGILAGTVVVLSAGFARRTDTVECGTGTRRSGSDCG